MSSSVFLAAVALSLFCISSTARLEALPPGELASKGALLISAVADKGGIACEPTAWSLRAAELSRGLTTPAGQFRMMCPTHDGNCEHPEDSKGEHAEDILYQDSVVPPLV